MAEGVDEWSVGVYSKRVWWHFCSAYRRNSHQRDLFDPDTDPVAPEPSDGAIAQNPPGHFAEIGNSDFVLAQTVFQK